MRVLYNICCCICYLMCFLLNWRFLLQLQNKLAEVFFFVLLIHNKLLWLCDIFVFGFAGLSLRNLSFRVLYCSFYVPVPISVHTDRCYHVPAMTRKDNKQKKQLKYFTVYCARTILKSDGFEYIRTKALHKGRLFLQTDTLKTEMFLWNNSVSRNNSRTLNAWLKMSLTSFQDCINTVHS